MASLKKINSYFLMSCIIGLVLSCYALLVEIKKEQDYNYEAYCDISDYISCSKTIASKYGKGFGIVGHYFGEDSILNQPNCLAGIFFYLILAITSFKNSKAIVKFQIFSSFISNILSIYLAYILIFIVKSFCLICVATYVVNAVNLILSRKKWNIIKESSVAKTKKSM